MNLTHRARSLLAGPRRELASVLALMAFVLAVLGVHVLCSVHLDEQADGAGHAHQAGAVVESAVDPSAVDPLGADPHCADHGAASPQADPLRAAPQGPALVPDLAVQWLVPAIAEHAPRTASGVVAATAPSLHALGISRT